MTEALDPLTYDVLDHIARYRIGVPEALVKTPPFADFSLKRVKRILHALTTADGDGAALLASAPLFANERYFYLTRAGETAIGEPEAGQGAHRRAGALSEVAKVRAYGVLAFCCLADRPRQRLTPEEFRQSFPGHHRFGLPMSYYADREARRLGFVRVDTGGGGRWDRIAQKVREDAERHRMIPAFRDAITAGTFELAVVSATERKAGRLRVLFEEEPLSGGLPVRVQAVPRLIELIAPPPGD
jgi:hypothetical protein